jgi:ubiquinone/menaquinone biosynthesis C-methylase UbiE
MMDAEEQTASYYDQTAGAYDHQVDGVGSNRAIRTAFRNRVASATQPGRTILDFGCGTGIDADWYSGRAYRVIAYDISVGMVDQLNRQCAPAIAAGAVTPVAGGWDALARQLQTSGPVSTVAANFAVLNHFGDLDAALRRFAPYLAPQGAVVASVLSPFYWRDVITRWWWDAAIEAAGRGAITVTGAVTTHRFLPGTIRHAGRREFELTELLGFEDHAKATVLRPIGWWTVLRTQFWLAVWRKRC